MNHAGLEGTCWEGFYQVFEDAAGEAFEKAWRRYLSGAGENPMEWGPGKVMRACKQAKIDIYRREIAQKRGGDVLTLSLSQPLPATEGLAIGDTISNRHRLLGSVPYDPEQIILAKEALEELHENPMEACCRGLITQEEAAERLGVSQSTVSRRLRA